VEYKKSIIKQHLVQIKAFLEEETIKLEPKLKLKYFKKIPDDFYLLIYRKNNGLFFPYGKSVFFAVDYNQHKPFKSKKVARFTRLLSLEVKLEGNFWEASYEGFKLQCSYDVPQFGVKIREKLIKEFDFITKENIELISYDFP